MTDIKHIFAALAFLLTANTFCPHNILAQKTQKAQKVEPPTVEENIAAYRFDAAEEQLNAEIKKLTARRKPTDALKAQLAYVQRMQTVMDATQRITFIDSLVVPKDEFFRHFALSEESGQIISYAKAFRTRDTLQCTLFRPEIGNYAYYAQPLPNGTSRLAKATLVAGDWKHAEMLAGLDDDQTQNFPFMLTDGITMFYGAINENEGLGGYDIYTTRWDIDNKTFLQPENIGMPFNSAANDYMLAIDELNQIGWFATDRRQAADSVCIYIFIPNDIRQNWRDVANLDNETMARMALISSIAETQTNNTLVEQAQNRLSAVRTQEHTRVVTPEFTFYLADNRVCHFLTDFTSDEARTLAAEWKEMELTLKANANLLQHLRSQYASQAEDAQLSQLRPQLLSLEREYEQQLKDLEELANRVRVAEPSR